MSSSGATRIYKACDQYRGKKKSDTFRPKCSCQVSGHVCTYYRSEKQRGLPEGYSRRLEGILAIAISKLDNFEDQILSILGVKQESLAQLKRHECSSSMSASAQQPWKYSRLYSVLRNPELANMSMLCCPSEVSSMTEPSGFPTDVDCYVSNSPSLAEPPKDSTVRITSPAMDFRPFDDEPIPLPTAEGGSRSSCLPPATIQILDRYFARTHPWFPILDKQTMIRSCHLYTAMSYPDAVWNSGSADYAALCALISYSTCQHSTLISEKSRTPPSETKKFYLMARALIPLEMKNCQLGHIQALLLLALININFQQWAAAKLLSVKSLDLAFFLGLDKTAKTTKFEEGQLSKDVLLGCHIIDSFLAFGLSQPTHGKRKAYQTIMLSEDTAEEWVLWSDVLPACLERQGKQISTDGPLHVPSCFNNLFELSTMMNQITQAILLEVKDIPRATELISELGKWNNTLPLGCQVMGPESIYPERHSSLLPHQTFMTLAYIATLLPLYLHVAADEVTQAQVPQPSWESAKKLLYRALLIVRTHRNDFSSFGIPPIFVLCLQSIVRHAASMRDISAEDFPFDQWAKALFQHLHGLCPALPIFQSLVRAIKCSFPASN
ncbi:C6 transcription factor [Penicillium odoratum]|uniref:C6 transcription factor n=1 Tax=Penicillium odoratum TaxID=1167516 RepID=UPI0025491959|nr:C6 transcription factor [Penicillium odoratum]KAJ5745731.1 C6 transcription factor [Penicillium odoratum]